MSTFTIAVLMGLLYWFVRLRFGYTLSAQLLQPVTIAVFVGLFYGDMANAMIIGAGIQLVYLGVTSTPGGNVPSDPALAACIAIPVALQTGMEPAIAVALAVPFGVLGVFGDQLRRTVNATFVHMADRYAEEANTKGILRAAFLYPAFAGFLIRFPPVFIATYYGEAVVTKFLDSIPVWLTHSFEIMGGILPALGFALTIMVIGKKKLIPFFILGFFTVKYFQIDVMAAAIFGTCLALLYMSLAPKEGANA